MSAGALSPALGDRVVVDVVLFGEVYAVEVVVVQVDARPGMTPRIIGRPEGTEATAYARTEWREVSA